MIFSPEHNVVVYAVDNPAQIAAAIGGARAVNASLVAVPATLFSLQLARLLGLPAPQIMDRSYDWPAQGVTPYAHQKHMSNFMALHPRCFNLGDMGVGKTLATLWAADYLMREGAIHRALIVSPLSTLKRTWENEIHKHFLGRRRARVLHGSRELRNAELALDADFYIINPDGVGVGTRRGPRGMVLGELAQAIRDRPEIDLIIVDECSAYKDGTTQRYRILRQAVGLKPYLWLLSGTPTPNAPTDAWSLSRLVGTAGGESFASFKARTMTQVTEYKWVPKPGSAEIVAKALSPSIRYARADCIDLPECVYETRDVALSPTQKVAYDTLRKDLVLTLRTQTITAVNEAVLRLKLIQIATGALYGPDREIHRTDCSPRLEVLKEVIDEAGGKILVFAPLTSVVNLVYSELRGAYGDGTVARIYGGTTQNARSEIFRAFEEDANPRIIVADPGTMSHGLTLVAANTIVWFGPTDKAEIYEQANARINRPGQKRKMLIVRLASIAVEREIYRRLAEKASMQGAVLALAEEGR